MPLTSCSILHFCVHLLNVHSGNIDIWLHAGLHTIFSDQNINNENMAYLPWSTDTGSNLVPSGGIKSLFSALVEQQQLLVEVISLAVWETLQKRMCILDAWKTSVLKIKDFFFPSAEYNKLYLCLLKMHKNSGEYTFFIALHKNDFADVSSPDIIHLEMI